MEDALERTDFLPQAVAPFLEPCDALNFAAACKKLQSSLCLSKVISPLSLACTEGRWYGDCATGNVPRHFQKVVLLLPARTHTVQVTGRMKDQGWGNRKSQLFVLRGNPQKQLQQSMQGEDTDGETPRFDASDIVCESEIASHTWDHVRLAFPPEQGATYHIWYKVGGGGGHELFVQELTVSYLVYDDEVRSLRQQCNALVHNHAFEGTNPFYLQLLKAAVVSVASEDSSDLSAKPNALVAMLEDAGMCPSSSQHMQTLVELVSTAETVLAERDRLKPTSRALRGVQDETIIQAFHDGYPDVFEEDGYEDHWEEDDW